jgi:hypothetical protein
MVFSGRSAENVTRFLASVALARGHVSPIHDVPLASEGTGLRYAMAGSGSRLRIKMDSALISLN